MQAATNRIASFLTASGNSAKSGVASTTNGQATSFQQALPSVSVPTTFTHETFSGDGSASSAAGSTSGSLAGRKLKQVLIVLQRPVGACPVNMLSTTSGQVQLLLSGRGRPGTHPCNLQAEIPQSQEHCCWDSLCCRHSLRDLPIPGRAMHIWRTGPHPLQHRAYC